MTSKNMQDRVSLLITSLTDKKRSASSLGTAIDELGHSRDARAVEPLIKLLDDTRRVVEIGSDYEGPLYASVVVALYSIGEAAIDPLIQIVLQDERGLRRTNAANALANIKAVRDNDHIIDLLISGIRSSDADRRCSILKIFRSVGTPRAANYVIQALSDPASSVKEQAAIIIRVDFKTAEAIHPLLNLLRHDPDAGVAIQAIAALKAIGDKAIIPELTDLLSRMTGRQHKFLREVIDYLASME